MTKKERIRELENKIVELEARIETLELKYLWVYPVTEYRPATIALLENTSFTSIYNME